MSLSRRSLLLGALAGSAHASLPGRHTHGAEPKPATPTMSLGFSLYGMRSLKPTDAIRTCAEIGYDGVELTLFAGWPTEPRKLRPNDRREIAKALKNTGLSLPSLMENVHLLADEKRHGANLDRIRAAADLGHELSTGKQPIIETVVGGKSDRWEQRKRKMAERLADWAKVAQQCKTVVAVKPHVGGALHTPEGAIWLIQQVASPWIKMVYDYSHYTLINRGLAETIDIAAPQTVFVHAKDGKRVDGKVRFLLPGEGPTDFGRYMQLLKAAGFAGPVVVEVSSQIHRRPGYDPVAAAKLSYANMAAALKEAGVRRRSNR